MGALTMTNGSPAYHLGSIYIFLTTLFDRAMLADRPLGGVTIGWVSLS